MWPPEWLWPTGSVGVGPLAGVAHDPDQLRIVLDAVAGLALVPVLAC